MPVSLVGNGILTGLIGLKRRSVPRPVAEFRRSSSESGNLLVRSSRCFEHHRCSSLPNWPSSSHHKITLTNFRKYKGEKIMWTPERAAKNAGSKPSYYIDRIACQIPEAKNRSARAPRQEARNAERNTGSLCRWERRASSRDIRRGANRRSLATACR